MPDDVRRNRWGTMLLLVLSSMLALAIGEAAARKLGLSKTWSSYVSAPDYVSLEMTTGQLVGYRRLPNGSWKAPFHTWTRTNSDGFRGPELPRNPIPDRWIRLLYLGDSVAEGYGVTVQERFSALTSQELVRRGAHGVESVNLSVAGHSTYDQIVVWEDVGRALDPDVVIVQVGDNDVGGNWLKRDAFESGDWERPNVDQPADRHRCVLSWWPGADPPCGLKRFLQGRSALYLAVAERYQTVLIRGGRGLDKSVFLQPVSAERWTATRHALLRLLDDLEGVRTVILYVPVEARVLAPEDSLRRGLGDLLTDTDLSSRATLMDMTAVLRTYSGEQLFLDDVHLTRRGHEIVAAALLEVLLRTDESDRPGESAFGRSER